MESELREYREARGLLQKEVAEALGISLRSYKSYENEEAKRATRRYEGYLRELKALFPLGKYEGVLALEEIERGVLRAFNGHEVHYCYLFGSYAKGKATSASDVDLLVSTPETGLAVFSIAEALRRNLFEKDIDLVLESDLPGNPDLLHEILKDGIKIY